MSQVELGVVIALGAIFASSVTVIRQWLVPGTKRPQLHHFYYGLVVLAPMPEWVDAIGYAMLADDALQHFIQAVQQIRYGRWTFYSPIYRVYVALARRLAARFPSLPRRFPFLFR